MAKILIHEVGLRDGLQMEQKSAPTELKIKWIDSLVNSGVDIIQVGSFVHPVKMPQMADTDEIFTYLTTEYKKSRDVIFSGLVLNEKGVERAFKCGVDMICFGVSASETHSQKNTGMSVADATKRIVEVAKMAMNAGKKVQASVQSAFGCGFEGKVDPAKVIGIVDKYLDAGIRNISLADTAGHANTKQVELYFTEMFNLCPDIVAACHFHNTYGLGMANTLKALEVGVQSLETAVGGLGGCPFTKTAAGNVSTEDLVHSLQRMGYKKGIDLNALIDIAKDLSEFLGKELPGLVYKTGPIK